MTSKTQNVDSNVSNLPNDFASKLLDLEIQLDSDQFNFEGVCKLNQLYITAIDYYIGIDDVKKANYFQKKLMNLLGNSKTLAIIQPKVKVGVSRVQLTSSVKEQLHKFNTQAEQYVKGIIQTSEKKLAKSTLLIKEDLNKQQQQFNKRLHKRIKSRAVL